MVGKLDFDELVALKGGFHTLEELRRQPRFANVQYGLHALSSSFVLSNFRIGEFFHLSLGNLRASRGIGKHETTPPFRVKPFIRRLDSGRFRLLFALVGVLVAALAN